VSGKRKTEQMIVLPHIAEKGRKRNEKATNSIMGHTSMHRYELLC